MYPYKHIILQQYFRGKEAFAYILTGTEYVVYSRFNILNMLAAIVKIYLLYKPNDDLFIL
jgi:hypothetical protein